MSFIQVEVGTTRLDLGLECEGALALQNALRNWVNPRTIPATAWEPFLPNTQWVFNHTAIDEHAGFFFRMVHQLHETESIWYILGHTPTLITFGYAASRQSPPLPTARGSREIRDYHRDRLYTLWPAIEGLQEEISSPQS